MDEPRVGWVPVTIKPEEYPLQLMQIATKAWARNVLRPRGPVARRQRCPVCGRIWWPCAGGILRCHARCYFNEAESAVILEGLKVGAVTQLQAGQYLGIGVGVVRSIWLRGPTPDSVRADEY